MAKLVAWSELRSCAQRQVEDRFSHLYHTTDYTTFREWAKTQAFYVREDGLLDDRYTKCEPQWVLKASPWLAEGYKYDEVIG